jgi:hypothetical protein
MGDSMMKCITTCFLTIVLSTFQANAASIAFVFKYDTGVKTSTPIFMEMFASKGVDVFNTNSAKSGVLIPGKDHRDTISNWWPISTRPYGTYNINICCEAKIEDFFSGPCDARTVNIYPSNKLQTVTVRATCALDQNNMLHPPSNIEVIGPYY